jgi:hypothetical protein
MPAVMDGYASFEDVPVPSMHETLRSISPQDLSEFEEPK